MPNAAVVATTLTDGSNRVYTLTVDGADVLGAFSGATVMVPIESISVTEAAPGDVSDMRFTIWDPTLQVTLDEMAQVQFWDVANSLPIFRGWVEEFTVRTDAIGRWIDVSCLGVEKVLDWMVITADVTFAAAADPRAAVQALTAQAAGVGVTIRAFSSSADNGNQAAPIGDLGGRAMPQAVTVTAGTSLREALRQVLAPGRQDPAGPSVLTTKAAVTVDFTLGLRVFDASSAPTDYDTLAISDSIGAADAATKLDHSTDGGAIPHQVWIIGGNAAGTGMVTDGTGLPGPIAVLNDASSTTAVIRDDLGTGYLAQYANSTRGTVVREAWNPTTNIRPNSSVTFVNTQIGSFNNPYRIASINKTFFPVAQTWIITYGSPRRDVTRTIHRALFRTRS